MNDPVLVLSWLVLLHLVADFVLQTDAAASRKSLRGLPGLAGILAHVLVTAVCFAPVAIAFGGAGLAFVIVVVVSHAGIDWLKVTATRRAEAQVLLAAEPTRVEALEETTLGPAWTMRPAAYFLADQVAHVVVLVAAWRALLVNAAPTALATDLVARLVGGADPATVHRVVLVAVVGLAVVIVNVSAAALFVALLLKPARVMAGPASLPSADHPRGGSPAPALPGRSAEPRTAWRVRLGPLSGTLEPMPPEPAPVPREPAGPGSGAEATEPAGASPSSAGLAPPLNVGRAIGIFERLLVAMLIVAQAEAAVALVVGVKTIARFRQLDDRAFAEYYLLGTLASVSIAVASGLVARIVLQGT